MCLGEVVAAFVEDGLEVGAVVGVAVGGDEGLELGFVDEAFVEGDFFEAGDFEALLAFDGGDVVAGFDAG